MLALLEGDHTGAVTIATLRECGVKSPAQAVYELQLAGYPIDRVSCTDTGGRKTLGYRLQRPTTSTSDQLAAARQVDGESAD